MKQGLLFLVYCFLLAVGAMAQNPGDTIFNYPNIHNINITFTQTGWWDSLMYYKQHADSFNLSTQPMMGNVIFDGTLIDSVGVTFKGNGSFSGYPGRKKPIKISFNQFVQGKKLEGLTTINLNNNFLDPTMMREKLLLDFMNVKGLPAPRCTYARVSYNGQYVGLYKIVEQVNKEFCKTHFSDWGGNLFKGDPGGSLGYINSNPASYYPNYELHSNTTANDWTDLVNLIDNICNTPAVNFYDTLETNLNTTPVIQQWAARNLFVDLDAYYHAAHNYYLYHNTTTGKFEWCTWDVSVAFGFYPFLTEDSTVKTSVLMANTPLTIRMLLDTTYKTTYLNTICDYLDYFKESVLFPQIDSIAAKIYPGILAESDTNKMFPTQTFYSTLDSFTYHMPSVPPSDIPALKRFITNRRNNVIAQLNSLGWSCMPTNVTETAIAELPITLSPNPATNHLNISTGGIAVSEINIYNTTGSLVSQTKQPLNNVIDISALPAGMYVAVIKTKEGSAMRKWVKM